MLEWANGQLAYEGHGQGHKAGICTMIERILMDAGCYNGYNYLITSGDGYEYTRQYYGI